MTVEELTNKIIEIRKASFGDRMMAFSKASGISLQTIYKIESFWSFEDKQYQLSKLIKYTLCLNHCVVLTHKERSVKVKNTQDVIDFFEQVRVGYLMGVNQLERIAKTKYTTYSSAKNNGGNFYFDVFFKIAKALDCEVEIVRYED